MTFTAVVFSFLLAGQAGQEQPAPAAGGKIVVELPAPDGSHSIRLAEPRYVTDLKWRVLKGGFKEEGEGGYFFVPAGTPAVLNFMLDVPEFGKVVLRADNAGQGYTVGPGQAIQLKLLEEVAKTACAGGEAPPAGSSAPALYSILAKCLFAREEAAVKSAAEKISAGGDERKALLGFSPTTMPVILRKYYIKTLSRSGFSHLLLRLYWRDTEPEPGLFDLRRGFKDLEPYLEAGFSIDAEGLITLEPGEDSKTLKGLQFDQLVQAAGDHVKEVVSAFPEVESWIVAHELNYRSMAGDLTMEQAAELAGEAIAAGSEANPKARFGIYLGYPDGYFAATHRQGPQDDYTSEPYSFVEKLSEAGVTLDFIALPFTYGSCLERLEQSSGRPALDLATISELLDWYGTLGAPVRISEVNFPSKPDACVWGRWHRDPDPALQAEYLSGLYAIAASKPFVERITYYLATDESYFRADTGLFDRRLKPKPALAAISKAIGRGGIEIAGKDRKKYLWGAAVIAAFFALTLLARTSFKARLLAALSLGAFLFLYFEDGCLSPAAAGMFIGAAGMVLKNRILMSFGACWALPSGLFELFIPETHPFPLPDFAAFLAHRAALVPESVWPAACAVFGACALFAGMQNLTGIIVAALLSCLLTFSGIIHANLMPVPFPPRGALLCAMAAVNPVQMLLLAYYLLKLGRLSKAHG